MNRTAIVADVESEELKLKIVNLTIESDYPKGGLCRILFDGEPAQFCITKMELTCDLDAGWTIKFHGFPKA